MLLTVLQATQMNLTRFNFAGRRPTAIVLGAGATRGASFVKPESIVKPPLDGDFFKILRVSTAARHDHRIRQLLGFVTDEFGSHDIRMESFYSQANLHDRFVSQIPTSKAGRRKSYSKRLEVFRSALPALLGESLSGHYCDYHDLLVKTIDANDTIISFNYDCLIDESLSRRAGKKWDARKGYGFAIENGYSRWHDRSGAGRPPVAGIQLLKPHGSLNWQRVLGKWNLRELPYESRPDADLHIVPPLWQKDFAEDPYQGVWAAARRVLTSVSSLLFVGYSLPDTDVYSQAMLRIDVGELDFLGIANPDPIARRRIQDALRSSIGPETHIVELDSMAQVAALLH